MSANSIAVQPAISRTSTAQATDRCPDNPLAVAADHRPQFRVWVRAGWAPDVSAGLVAAVVKELAAIWTSNGIEVVRYDDRVNSMAQLTVTLVLVRTPPPSSMPEALGWIGFLDGAGAVPVIQVSLPAALALVKAAHSYGIPVPELPHALQDHLFARALGRTAAHELGHYLLALRRHPESGLMRDRFSTEQLIGDDRNAFRLSRSERDLLACRMRSSLAEVQSAAARIAGR